MRIGISVLTHMGQSVWENGLGQNVFYFAQLLRALPFVTDVVLLNCGDQPGLPPEAEEVSRDFRLVPVHEATDLIDVAIEMGGGLDVEWLDYLRALGKKVVFLCCGQPYAGLIEPSVFRKGGYFSRADRCDEIWVLSKDRVFAPLLRTLHRCPVFEVPYLWEPVFLEQRVALLARAGFPFGYVPRAQQLRHGPDHESYRHPDTPRALRVAIFEPNISVLKCCVIPMLVCEAAFRASPDAIARMNVLNSIQMKEHHTFGFLLRSLDLERHGKVHLDQRHDFAGYMSQFADAVVAHQWQNDQNTLYLDALYGGYALIHNSPWLKGVGYYYPDSDIDAGARALLTAAHQHDASHAVYVCQAREFLAQLSPHTRRNQTCYAQRLLHLNAPRTHHAAGEVA